MGATSVTGKGEGSADVISRGINLKKYIGNTYHPFLLSQAIEQVDEPLVDLTWTRIKFEAAQSIVMDGLSIDDDGIITMPPGHWLINGKICTHHSGDDFVTVLGAHIYNEDLSLEIPYTYSVYSLIVSGNLPITVVLNNIVCNPSDDDIRISIRAVGHSSSEDADILFGYHSDTVLTGSTNYAGTIAISRIGSYGI